MADKKVEFYVGSEYQDLCCTVLVIKVTSRNVHYTVTACRTDRSVIGETHYVSKRSAIQWVLVSDPFDVWVRDVRSKKSCSTSK